MGKIHAASGFFVVSLMTVGLLIADRNVNARQTIDTKSSLPRTTPTPSPADTNSFSEYRGIAIGTSTNDVRTKLGSPKDKSDAQDFYSFSDDESAQFYYSDGHLVTAIMITYIGNLKAAPTPKQVFGEDVPPKADGGVSRMVRYPKAGYWISYNRGSGDDAMITIAIQKI